MLQPLLRGRHGLRNRTFINFWPKSLEILLACWFSLWSLSYDVYVGIENAENVSRRSPASRRRFCCCVLAACKRSFINSRDVIQGDLFPFMVQHDSTSWMKYDLYSYNFTFRSHKNHVCVPFRQVYSIIDTYPRASRISTSSVLKALHVDQVSPRSCNYLKLVSTLHVCRDFCSVLS